MAAAPPGAAAGLAMLPETLIQNMMLLASDLKLPIAYKVTEALGCDGDGAAATADAGTGAGNAPRTFFVIVHVHGDYAFKRYLQLCSRSDLMLFRGLLLKVVTSSNCDTLLSARVQQAFLPKFENEGQDESVANEIVAGAHERYMVATIKHSGSLVTLSGVQGFAAKNSQDNKFTAGAATLLQAHYARACGGDSAAATAKLCALMEELRKSDMSVSFEMVTGCHGHHGQIPAAEYLVATSAHTLQPHTGRPVFLAWHDFMQFCLQQGLPVNDTWLFAGQEWASHARDALDSLALWGGPTARAMSNLASLVSDGLEAGCLHLPGTYPHAQWQGSRIEGFVVAQGQAVGGESAAQLTALLPGLRAGVLDLASVPQELRQPYRTLLDEAGDDEVAVQVAVRELCAAWLPRWRLKVADIATRNLVVGAMKNRRSAFSGTSVDVPSSGSSSTAGACGSERVYVRAAIDGAIDGADDGADNGADAPAAALLAVVREGAARAAQTPQQQQQEQQQVGAVPTTFATPQAHP